MSLNTAQLKVDLKALYAKTYTSEGDAEQALDDFVEELADKLEAYIKTAVIVYSNGLTAGANPVTGIFNGHLQ